MKGGIYMKDNIVYVDFTRKKIANNKKVSFFDQLKEHIKSLFYFVPNKLTNSSRSKQCKRIL